MPKSIILDQIHKLKVAAEYSVLLTKLRLMNEIGQYYKEILPEDVLEFCNKNNILYTDTEKENIKEISDSLKVYIANPDNYDEQERFRQSLGIVTCPRLDILLDNDDISLPVSITMISSVYYDEIYEKICDRLNEIEAEYNDIVKAMQGV